MTDQMDNYRIVDALSESQISDLMELYQNEFWCDKRTREDVVKMLAATDVIIGLVDGENRLIGFVRALTDFTYRAMICDLIVKPAHRKTGLGAVLMDAVVNHPQLQAVESLSLGCLPQMIPFYERWGFTDNLGKIKFMRRTNP